MILKYIKLPQMIIFMLKPNEIFNTFGLPQGNYRIQIDFLNQVKPTFHMINAFYQFIIKQISTSRKEVRLKPLNFKISENDNLIQALTIAFEQNTGTYQFDYILNIGTGNHNPIMNYAFDKVTDGKDNQSIILKLYEPLPTIIGKFINGYN